MTGTIGGLVIDLGGLTLTQEDKELIANPLVGGVIYFARNYNNPEQITQLTKDIRATRRTPLLVMVDQEGGRVQRFMEGFSRIPAMGLLAHDYQTNPEATFKRLKEIGWLMAYEILMTGIDLSLAPVVDLDIDKNPAIGNRAFSDDPVAVSMLGTFFCEGMKEAGMSCTAKHFPGHGSVKVDSHKAKPIDQRTFKEVQKSDLLPFTNLIHAGVVDAILASHIQYPNIDENPVGFSRYWLQNVLRKKMGFDGAILSDDLSMEGGNISANPEERVAAAFAAGCDFALLCNNRKGVIKTLDTLKPEDHQVEPAVWQRLQGDFLKAHRYTSTDRHQKSKALLEKTLAQI